MRMPLTVLCTAYVISGPCHAAAASGDLALLNARIYSAPEAVAVERGMVVIHAGRIARITAAGAAPPVGATVIDLKGATVTAGFWNSHVHLLTPPLLHARDRTAAQLAAELGAMFTRWGFTTVFDLASSLDNAQVIRQRIASGEVTGPRILTVGDPFFPEHGTPIYVRKFMQDNGFPSDEVASASAAAARARRELHSGADGVKIFAGAIVGGDVGVLPMPLDIAAAIVREAHRVGKPAFAHPSNAAGIEVSIRSGVDVLAHTAGEMGEWDQALIAQMMAHHMALIPTLTLFESENRKAHASPEQLERVDALTTGQLRDFAAAGGTILFGTDVGYIDIYDTTREYELMSRVLDWRQILASLTTNPATRFAHGGGRIEPGASADLTVLDKDPAADVTAFAQVRYTIRAGKILYQHADASAP